MCWVLETQRVDFTKLCATSKNAPANSIRLEHTIQFIKQQQLNSSTMNWRLKLSIFLRFTKLHWPINKYHPKCCALLLMKLSLKIPCIISLTTTGGGDVGTESCWSMCCCWWWCCPPRSLLRIPITPDCPSPEIRLWISRFTDSTRDSECGIIEDNKQVIQITLTKNQTSYS